MSAPELALLLSTPDRTISRMLEKAGVLANRGAGGYETIPALKAIVASYADRSDKLSKTVEEDKARKIKAEADSAEMDYERSAGALAFICDVEAIWKDGFAQIRTLIESAGYLKQEQKLQLSKDLLGVRVDPIPNAAG